MKTMRTNPPLGKNSASTPTMAPNTYLKAQQVSEGHANTKINKIKISYYIGLCDSSEFLYDSSNPTLNTKICEDNQKQESESEFNDGELYYEQSI